MFKLLLTKEKDGYKNWKPRLKTVVSPGVEKPSSSPKGSGVHYHTLCPDSSLISYHMEKTPSNSLNLIFRHAKRTPSVNWHICI